MNNGESIKKYNDLLIGFLNDLVNSIDNPENNKVFFEDIANRLKQQLSAYSMDIASEGVKTMMNNAFKEYSNILKKHFDGSNIHKIDINTQEDMISNEMNTVTVNLANAVTNMNKIAEYINLVDRIKSSLKGYFSQTYPNYQSLEFEVEQILNETILGSFNAYTTRKIDDFSKLVLPDLYTIEDSITYDHEVHTTEDNNYDVNLERDNFIRDTMDIEIEEGFENGVVTLKITDEYDKTTVYYSTEAMEKLTGYNQLFESSRPGKKVDTSNWALDKSNLQPEGINTNNIDNSNSLDTSNNMVMNNNLVTDNIVNNNPIIEDTANNNVINNDVRTNENENLIKDFLATHSNDSSINNSSDSLVDVINNNTNLNNNINTNTTIDNTVDNTINNNFVNNVSTPTQVNDSILDNNNVVQESNEFSISNDEFGSFTTMVNDSNPMNMITDNNAVNNTDNNNELDEQKNLINSIVGSSTPINNDDNQTELTNNIDNSSAFEAENKIVDENIQKARSELGTNDTSYSSGFMFLPEFDQHNQERNEFIKKTTGIEIDEDVDNNGRLYLKVVEPTGREQIYTGKEAVNMIKNFNKVYLDSNPDKKVDTSLIDDFKE